MSGGLVAIDNRQQRSSEKHLKVRLLNHLLLIPSPKAPFLLDKRNRNKYGGRDTNELVSLDLAKEYSVAASVEAEKSKPEKRLFYITDNILKVILREDSDGDNLILLALILQRADLARQLVDLVPEHSLFDRWNKLYQTALHIAVLISDPILTRRLVVAGSRVDRQDWIGNTPLHIACRLGCMPVAESLLKPVSYSETKQNKYNIPYQKIPQNLEIRNADGVTCLLIAACRRNVQMMDLLLSKDADINAVDMKSGKTCLHMFAEIGDSEMVKYALNNQRLMKNTKTYAGFTALEFAHYRGHQSIVNMLLNAGAEYGVRSFDSTAFLAQSDSDDSDFDNDIDVPYG